MKHMQISFVALVGLLLLCMGNSTLMGQSPGGSGGSSEMPPALQNMASGPEKDAEMKKWEQSQHPDPKSTEQQVQRNLEILRKGKWVGVPQVPSVSSSKGTPYHNYQGITDPAKAKEAWAKDHPDSGGR